MIISYDVSVISLRFPHFLWIGWTEKIQESPMIFIGKFMVSTEDFPAQAAWTEARAEQQQRIEAPENTGQWKPD